MRVVLEHVGGKVPLSLEIAHGLNLQVEFVRKLLAPRPHILLVHFVTQSQVQPLYLTQEPLC